MICKMRQVLKNNKILAFSIIAYIILFIFKPELGIKGLKESTYYFIEMVQILPAVFVLTALIQTWIPTEVIMKNFGNGSGLKGKIISITIGSLSAGPIYAAFPVCRTLLDKGASVGNIVIILSSWAVVKVPMLMNEAKFMGTKYMAIRWIFTLIGILFMEYIMNKWVKPEDIKSSQKMNSEIPYVNVKICVGCGACIRVCPEVFIMKNKKAIVKNEVDFSILKKKIEETKKVCPVKAIM